MCLPAQQADAQGTGQLSIDDFCSKLGPVLGANVSRAELTQLFMKIDADCGGTVDWCAPLRRLLRVRQQPSGLRAELGSPGCNPQERVHQLLLPGPQGGHAAGPARLEVLPPGAPRLRLLQLRAAPAAWFQHLAVRSADGRPADRRVALRQEFRGKASTSFHRGVVDRVVVPSADLDFYATCSRDSTLRCPPVWQPDGVPAWRAALGEPPWQRAPPEHVQRQSRS